MNDICVEQLIKKKWEPSDTIKLILIVLGAFALMTFVAVVLYITAIFQNLILFLFVVIGYFACRLVFNLMVEYEYSVVNGEITVDKIIARRSRKRMVTIDAGKIEAFGRYDYKLFENRNFDVQINASECSVPDDAWYAEFHLDGEGNTLLVFSPDEKVLKAIKPFLRGSIARQAFKR